MTGAELQSLESMSPEEAARTLQELRVHQIELQMQNEELRRAQVELDAARTRYFDLYDLAPVGYVTVSEKGLILEANLTAARLLGVERGALVRRRLTSFILHDDEDIYYLQRKQLLETDFPRVCELRMVRPDGAQFWARIEAVKAEGTEDVQVFRVVISDITERKRSDEELQRSNTVLTGINTIFAEGHGCKTEAELGQNCLRVAKQITGSSLGFIGTVGPDGVFHDCAIGNLAWEHCIKCNQDGHGLPTCSFKLHERYGRVLQDGKSLLTNTPAGPPESVSTPAGYPALASFLGVPLVEGGRTVGMIGLGNREGGYQQQELDSLEALATSTTEAMHRKRAEEALRRSEEQLDTIYQDAPLIMLLVDGGGHIRKANRFAERFTGVPEAGMVGRCGGDAMRCLNALDNPNGCGYGPHCQTCTLRRTVLDTMATGISHQQVEASLPLAIAGNAQEVTFLLSTAGFNFRGESQVLVTIQDITERKRIEEALRVSEARYRVLFENNLDAIFLTVPDGRTGAANPAACAMFGMTEEEICRRGRQGLSDLDDPRLAPALEERARTGKFKGELSFFRNNGTKFNCEVNSVILPGDEPRSFVILHDITERKLAEEALLRSEKLASVGRMAASVAHEINNPLAAVMNALYLARTVAHIPEATRQYLDMADDELQRVSHITRQSLGFYREASLPQRVSVNAIMDSVVDLLRGKIKAKGARIEKQYDGNLEVTGVGGELRQVFSNLLANSLDAIAEAGTIRLRASSSTCTNSGQRRVRITVADDGTGIAAATLPRIFEPLFTTKGSTGSGLGLWVSKQIIEKHHGSMQVHSCTFGERRGTALSILLPAEVTP
jgi:PAS domain S-box-containing protein